MTKLNGNLFPKPIPQWRVDDANGGPGNNIQRAVQSGSSWSEVAFQVDAAVDAAKDVGQTPKQPKTQAEVEDVKYHVKELHERVNARLDEVFARTTDAISKKDPDLATLIHLYKSPNKTHLARQMAAGNEPMTQVLTMLDRIIAEKLDWNGTDRLQHEDNMSCVEGDFTCMLGTGKRAPSAEIQGAAELARVAKDPYLTE